MKIAVVAPYDFSKIGGVEKYILSVCEQIRKEHQLTIFTDAELRLDGVTILPLSAIESSSGFDYCFSHAIYGASVLPQARIGIHVFHGTILGNLFVRPKLWFHPRFWLWLLMEYRSLNGKDGIICVSDWALREARLMGCRLPLVSIPGGGGVKSQRIGQKQTSEFLNCLFCGRVSDKVKRFALIRSAFVEAQKTCPNLRLYIAGGDKSEEHLEGIYHLGQLNSHEVQELIVKCDVQLNASFYEGYSLSLAEGIFQGALITLATPVGGNLQQVIYDKTGFFFSSDEQLTEYLVRLAKEPQLVEDMRKEIISATNILSWEEVYARTMQFAEELGKNEQVG